MSKIINLSFVYLTVINISLLIIIYVLFHREYRRLEVKPKASVPIRTNTIVVKTDVGSFVGVKSKQNRVTVGTFLGIPYAKPPVDLLRFKAPVEIKFENQTIESLQWPNPCFQPDNRLQLFNSNFSEDCLYLNIWTPVSKTKQLKPVLVLIHTGAFIFGSSSEVTYNGIELSSWADIVVVTFNYRLNFYGFFYYGTNEVVPNVGMLDQVAALKWINKHIDKFGGDPHHITLLGQSSGALSVGMHITSPLSQNLFSQAILMSGSPLQVVELNEAKNVLRFWNNFAKHIGCINDSNTSLSPQMIDCIDATLKHNRNLMPTMNLVKQLSLDTMFVNLPIVVDGQFQPKNQFELIEDLKNSTKKLSILYGYTTDEGSWIAMLDDQKRFGPLVEPKLTESEAEEIIKRFLKKTHSSKPFDGAKMLKHYLDVNEIQKDYLSQYEVTDYQSSAVLSQLATSVLGDHYISCPENQFANILLQTLQNVSIYQYYWNYKGNSKTSAFWNTFSRVWCGKWMGTCHSFEMYAIFGMPFQQPTAFNNEDKIVSIKSMQMIKYFLHKKKLFWNSFPQAPTGSKMYFLMDKSTDNFKFGFDLKRKFCNEIWRQNL